MCTAEFRSFKRSDGGQYGTNWLLYWQRKVGEKITKSLDVSNPVQKTFATGWTHPNSKLNDRGLLVELNTGLSCCEFV